MPLDVSGNGAYSSLINDATGEQQMTRTQDALQQAKNALLYALRVAEQENIPAALRKQLDTLAGKAETLQWKMSEKAK